MMTNYQVRFGGGRLEKQVKLLAGRLPDLFGVNANRVKEEIRDNLIRYQRECYRVLADAFLPPGVDVRPVEADDQALVQLHNMALVIAATTREMLEIRQLSLNNKTRLDAAREYLQGMNQRLKVVEHQSQIAEQRTRAGRPTDRLRTRLYIDDRHW